MKLFPSPAPRLVQWSVSLAVCFMAVMTLLRLGTYLAFDHGAVSGGQVAAAFWLGMRFDARVVASAMLALLALGALPFLHAFDSRFGRKFWPVLLGLFSAALVVFYVCDYLHYRYLNQRLNATALGFLADAQISAAMVWQTYPVVRLLLGMAAATAASVWVIGWLQRQAAAARPSPRKAVRVAWSTGAVLLCLFAIFGRAGQYPLRWSDAFNLRNESSAHLALNPLQAFFSSLSFRATGYELDKVREHLPRMNAYLGTTAGPHGEPSFERAIAPPAGGGPRPKNVVLVICESFSAYKSSMWGNALDTTPFFAELCRQGVFFDNCYTPHIGTARGVWATITGLPDVVLTETASRNPAMVDQRTIINDFTGHEKLYFLGGSTSWANIRGLLTNNIENLHLYEEGSYQSPRIDVWGISDKNLFLEAEAVLRRQTKPFFAIIQTADNHRPYTIPKEDLGEFAKMEVAADKLKAGGFESLAEFNAFRYTDFAFRKFFEAARQSPYFDDTLFVFIGDHGIAGNAGTMFPPAWTEQRLTSYHVPLLFYAPKFLKPQRIHAVASMVDVLPTIAGLAGISYHNTALGRDLLAQLALDGGRSNAAFVIDHHSRSIGLIRGQYFSNHQVGGTRHEFVWADFAAAPPVAPAPVAEGVEQAALASAFYETARYLLLNNRKIPPRRNGESSE